MPGPGKTYKAAESEDQGSKRPDRARSDTQGICSRLIKKKTVLELQ